MACEQFPCPGDRLRLEVVAEKEVAEHFENVLAAGEITFQGAMATEVTNQSTGYCTGEECWPAVADALDRADLQRPDGFTTVFVFRHCPECAELNVVKDEYYVCVFCDADLMRF